MASARYATKWSTRPYGKTKLCGIFYGKRLFFVISSEHGSITHWGEGGN